MVSAFEVYVVMQLDSIRAFFIGAAVISGGLGAGFLWVAALDECDKEPWAPKLKTKGTRLASWCVAALLCFSVTPSSTTAAAMILVPALTSDEVVEPVGREAAELYGLAKKALTNLAEDRPEPAKE